MTVNFMLLFVISTVESFATTVTMKFFSLNMYFEMTFESMFPCKYLTTNFSCYFIFLGIVPH